MHNVVRRLTAGILLLLFSFSITPKKTLHDLFARHRDVPVRSSQVVSPLLAQSGFHCRCDNQVVESPYVTDLPRLELLVPSGFGKPHVSAAEDFPTTIQFYTGLRGPPALS